MPSKIEYKKSKIHRRGIFSIKKIKKVKIGKSNIHGFGIIAKRDTKKGEIVFILKGKIVNFLVKNKKDVQYGPDWVGTGKSVWIDPDSFCRYINHSCNPNAGIRGKFTIVSLRDIKKGEEVTIDYSITEATLDWTMGCSCGEKNCRKVIRSIQFLPKKTFERYYPLIGNYFRNLYIKNHKN